MIIHDLHSFVNSFFDDFFDRDSCSVGVRPKRRSYGRIRYPAVRPASVSDTFVAKSVKIGNVTVNTAAEVSVGNRIDMLDWFHVQIDDSAAVFAYKVIMRSCIAVKSVTSITAGKLYDLTAFREQRKIAVYGSKTDIRINLTHFHIDSIRGRMFFRAAEIFLDTFPLAAVFCRSGRHRHSPFLLLSVLHPISWLSNNSFDNSNGYYNYNIIDSKIFVNCKFRFSSRAYPGTENQTGNISGHVTKLSSNQSRNRHFERLY